MWLLVACVDGAPDEKAPIDDADSGVRVDTSNTGDTDAAGDTGDTSNANDRCQGPATVLALPEGAASPHNVLLTPDLDGGGRPDVLHPERVGGESGIALLRGEDVAFGGTTAHAWLPPIAGGGGAGWVGYAGDLDGDGRREVLVGEVNTRDEAWLTLWSLARTDTPLATLIVDADYGSEFLAPAVEPAADLDGDGIPEVLAYRSTSDPEAEVYVFAGARAAAGDMDSGSAHLVVAGADGSFRPIPVADLDGDGVDDIVVSLHEPEVQHLLLLPGALAASGGVLDGADLDVLADTVGIQLPAFVDIDADGHPELYADDNAGGDDVMRGFTSAQVIAAARSGTPIDRSDAWLTFEAEGDDYLAAHILPVTDRACETGVAVSAHFGDSVYIVSNDALETGGRIGVADVDSLGGEEWFGYMLAGGQDLDLDGAMDLAIGNRIDALSVYLTPARLAEAP